MKVDELQKDSIKINLWTLRAIAKIKGFNRYYGVDDNGNIYESLRCSSCNTPDSLRGSLIQVDYNYVMPVAEKLNVDITRLSNSYCVTVASKHDSRYIDLLTAIKRCIIKSEYGEEVEG